MINFNMKSFEYIPIEKREECYNSMLRDVYYFYTGIKTDINHHLPDRFCNSSYNQYL